MRVKPKSFSARGRRIGTKQFLISGTLGLPTAFTSAGLTKSQICGLKNSRVSVQTKRGSTTLSTRRVSLKSNCTFRLRVTFSSTKRFGKSKSLKFKARFQGNLVLTPISARAFNVRLAKRR